MLGSVVLALAQALIVTFCSRFVCEVSAVHFTTYLCLAFVGSPGAVLLVFVAFLCRLSDAHDNKKWYPFRQTVSPTHHVALPKSN